MPDDDDVRRTSIAEQAARWLEPAPVVLPEIPRVYGLYRPEDAEATGDPRAGVVAWVVALPDGTATVMHHDESGQGFIGSCTGIERAMLRYGMHYGAGLVALAEHA